MKNWTLALAIGTAVATTAIGCEANPASALTISGVKATNIDIWGNLFVNPGGTTTFDVVGGGTFSWADAIPNTSKAKISQSLTITGDTPTIYRPAPDIIQVLQAESGTYTDSSLFFWQYFTLGKGNYKVEYTLNVQDVETSTNQSDYTPRNFEVKEAPEPLTILGTGVVLSAIPVLKKEYAKRKKKKDDNA